MNEQKPEQPQQPGKTKINPFRVRLIYSRDRKSKNGVEYAGAESHAAAIYPAPVYNGAMHGRKIHMSKKERRRLRQKAGVHQITRQ